MLATGVALALLTGACERNPAPEAPPLETRAVVIGLDGFEWDVALEMLAEGGLANLAALMKRGTYGTLASTRPTLSPIIWTSIATGVSADRHAIRGFVKDSGRAGRPPRLYTSRDRRAKALWNILTDAGIASYTIGWWNTFPVEPVKGVMVAQVNTITPRIRRQGRGIWKGELVADLDGQVHPPELEPQLLATLPRIERSIDGQIETVLGTDLTPARADAADSDEDVAASLLEQSRWAFRADALYRDITIELLAERPAPRLVAVYFGGADVVGHRFWRYANPDLYEHAPGAGETGRLGPVIARYYAYLDDVVGSLVDTLAPETNVIIVGDHGMGAANRRARYLKPQLSGGHLDAPPALFIAAGPQIRKTSPGTGAALTRERLPALGSVLDVLPTVLTLLGVPVGADMEGSVMTGVLDASFLERHPPTEIPTHTDDAWLASRRDAPERVRDQIERLEQLRSLGYIE